MYDLHYYAVVNITTIQFHYRGVTIFGTKVKFSVRQLKSVNEAEFGV